MEAAGSIVNAMTIDVEDYFHVSVFERVVSRRAVGRASRARVCVNTKRLLDIFSEHDVRATFFVLGWVAERYPQLVRDIAWAGHEIASHGYSHRLVYDQTPAAFREDVRRAKAVLELTSGTPVVGYRAPSYSVTARSLWALDILIEEGYQYDSSIFPIRHDRYGIPTSPRHAYTVTRPGGSLVEAPASTTRVWPDQPANRRRRIFPHSSVRLDEVGYAPGERVRAQTRDLLFAPMGDRSRAAALQRGRAEPIPPLP